MPSDPVADLIVAQARRALAAWEAVFDAVFGFGRAGELEDGGVGIGIREVVVVFESPLRLTFAREEQHLVGAGAAGPCCTNPCAGWDAAERDLERERPRRASAHVERGPRGLGERPTPPINALPRRLRRAAASRVFGRRNCGIAEQRVRRNGPQIAFVLSPQRLTQRPATAQFIVARDPAVRPQRTTFVEPLQRLGVPRLKRHVVRDSRRAAPRAVLRPLLGQIPPRVDQRVFTTRHVGHVDPHLTVVDLALPSAPLPRDTHRLRPLLREGPFVIEQTGGSNTITPSAAPIRAPTGRAHSVSNGACSHGDSPTNGGICWRSRPGRSAIPSPVLRSRFDNNPDADSKKCRRCASSVSAATNGSTNASSRSVTPSQSSADTCAGANNGSRLTSNRPSMADSLPGSKQTRRDCPTKP